MVSDDRRLESVVAHEVAHRTVLLNAGVPVRRMTVRPNGDNGWCGSTEPCECAQPLEPGEAGPAAAAGPLQDGDDMPFPNRAPGGYSDRGNLYQSAEALAEREGGPVSEHWEAAVERARRVLAESEEERAAVEARMVEAFEATGRDRKILFDSNGFQIAGPMPSCSHQNVKP
jgi:hypothetical protein